MAASSASSSATNARRLLLLRTHNSLSYLLSPCHQLSSPSTSLRTRSNPVTNLWQQLQYVFTRTLWRQSGGGGAGERDNGDEHGRSGVPFRNREEEGFTRDRSVDHELVKQRRRRLAFGDSRKKGVDVFRKFQVEDDEDEAEEEEEEEAKHQQSYLAKNEPGRSEISEQTVFGEQLAIAGLTEKDLDSLIAKMDFSAIQGLPPLEEILQYDSKGEQKAKRREMEMRKQKELAMSRIKQIDELGRAYATGRRKTSVARVWLSEGKGKIIINGKTHDMYFPSLDHRVQLLEPFCETQTLGKFNVYSTVKGGGITGQAGALRLGISRALQFYDPKLRSPLRTNGMLTRDPRSVERKKPGKAKARKSYQWVKR